MSRFVPPALLTAALLATAVATPVFAAEPPAAKTAPAASVGTGATAEPPAAKPKAVTAAPTGVVDPTQGAPETAGDEAAAVPPPRTSGDVAEVIVTAPDYGSREEVNEFHRQEFDRLDKLYGRKEKKETRSDVLSHASELDTGSTRNGMAADPLQKIINGN